MISWVNLQNIEIHKFSNLIVDLCLMLGAVQNKFTNSLEPGCKSKVNNYFHLISPIKLWSWDTDVDKIKPHNIDLLIDIN